MPADALYSGFYMQAPTKEIAGYATLLENLNGTTSLLTRTSRWRSGRATTFRCRVR